MNRFWVWNSQEKRVALEFGKFITVQGFNFILNNLFLVIFVALVINQIVLNLAGMVSPGIADLLSFIEGDDGNKLLAKFAATSLQLVTSFLFYKFFVFAKKEN